MLAFREMTIEDQALVNRYARHQDSQLSYYNFTCLFIWRDVCNYRICEHDGFLIITARMRDHQYCYFPLGNGDFRGICEEICETFGGRVDFFPIDAVMKTELEAVFGDRMTCEERMAQRDYVYRREALATLAGKKLHGKRNHVNKFRRLYPDCEYRTLDASMFDQCLELADVWRENTGRGGTGFMERDVIADIFRYYDDLPLRGGALLLDGRVIAFSVGEKMNDTTALIHIEKADTQFDGSFAMINQALIEHAFADVEFVNREEDMGIEGLRRAKMSYAPDHFNVVYLASCVGR